MLLEMLKKEIVIFSFCDNSRNLKSGGYDFLLIELLYLCCDKIVRKIVVYIV